METLSSQDEVTLIAAASFSTPAGARAGLLGAGFGWDGGDIATVFNRVLILTRSKRTGCTFITAVPPMIEARSRDHGIHLADLSSVRPVRLWIGSGSCRAFTMDCRVLPYAAILVGYGTTESGPVTFGAHPDGVVAPTPSLSYGYPHPDIMSV